MSWKLYNKSIKSGNASSIASQLSIRNPRDRKCSTFVLSGSSALLARPVRCCDIAVCAAVRLASSLSSPVQSTAAAKLCCCSLRYESSLQTLLLELLSDHPRTISYCGEFSFCAASKLA